MFGEKITDMRTTFTLIAFAFLFAACETVTPPPTTGSQDDDKDYFFDLSASIDDSTGADFTDDDITLHLVNNSYPDSAWTAWFSYFYCTFDQGVTSDVIIETDGNFTINFTEERSGEVDTIYGSGYFDEDTLYMNYHYERLDVPVGTYYGGDVSIHSL